MASPLVQATLKAPGFMGLNTEHSAAATRQQFASVLDNAVFDEAGKVQSRKGYKVLAESGPDSVDRVFYWRKSATSEKLMTVGDASGTATLYEMTTTTDEFDTFTSRGTANSTDLKLININGYLVALEAGQTPKVWDGTGTLANIAAATGTTANPTGGIGCAAFGRLFVVSSDRKVVHGSELQPDPKTTGINWDNWFIDVAGSTASGVAASEGWTASNDFITAVVSFEEYLVIFGLETILVYIYSDESGSTRLVDSVIGVGCVNQHSVCHTGDDLVFLSTSGVRSLRRSLRKDIPDLADVSAFVRQDVQRSIAHATAHAVYSTADGFYLLTGAADSYCFDMRQQFPGGSRRASRWTLTFNDAHMDVSSGRMFMAIGDKVCLYDGYLDNASSYKLTIKSQWLDLGRTEIKIAKKLSAVIFNGQGLTPKFTWDFDWSLPSEQVGFAPAIPLEIGAEWGAATSEYNTDDEWGGYADRAVIRTVQASGSGLNVRYGIEFSVNGSEVGVHEIRFFAKLGRLAHV